MDAKMSLAIQNFILSYTSREELRDEDIQTLIDEACSTYLLDNVYIMEKMPNSNKIVYSFISNKGQGIWQTGMEVLLSSKEQSNLARMYNEEHLSEQNIDNRLFSNIKALYTLHYGYFNGNKFQADIGFQSLSWRYWNEEEREAIKKLAYAVQGYLAIRFVNHKDKVNSSLQDREKVDEDIDVCTEAILKGIPGGFKISRDDAKFSYKYISKGAAAIQGYSIEEFWTHSKGNGVDNTYIADRMATYEKILTDYTKGNSYSCKYRVQDKNGQWKWVLESGCKVNKEDGEVEHHSYILDIDEFEKNALKLRNALSLLNQMLSSLSCGVLAYTLPERKVLLINEEAKRIFEWEKSRDTKLGYFWENNVLEEDKQGIRNKVRWLKRPGDKTVYTFRARNTKGEIMTIQAISKLLEYGDGTRFILSSVLDLTEQEKLHQMIAKERRLYRDALISNCYYYFSFDVTEGMITEEGVYKEGHIPFQVMGISLPIPYSIFIKKFIETYKPKRLSEGKEVVLNQERILECFRKGDTQIEIESYYPTLDRYGRISMLLSEEEKTRHVYACVFVQDTTEVRRKEEENKEALTKAYEAARQANAAKSDFLSRMSHDIRTPMNAIIGMTTIAEKNIENKKKVLECLSKITVSSNHLLGIINNILDMSKIERGELKLSKEAFNLPHVINNMIEMVRTSLDNKKQQLHVDMNLIKHENVIGDRSCIEQVLVNLMSNAIKYTPEKGHISIRICEKETTHAGIGTYEWIIEDTGIGIEEEFLGQIFEPFTRAQDSRVDKIQGTGLGMAIARNIINLMNGDINVESKVGVGTKVTMNISLELQEGENNNRNEEEGLFKLIADDKEHLEKYKGKRLLLVEDNELNQEIARELLEMTGASVEIVNNGKQAVEKVMASEEGEYSLIFMDIQMPIMNGYEATKAIRQLDRKDAKCIPIIAMTANAFVDDVQKAIQVGMNEHLAKPVDVSKLYRILDKWIV